jgi:archaellum component FlaC
MKAARFALALVIPLLFVVSGCDDGTSEQLENQMMQMQERLIELETQLADAQGHANRLDAAQGELDDYVRDVESEIIDLSVEVPRHLLVNVEAAVGNAKTKLEEVRARTDALGNTLRPVYGEAEE